MVVFDQMNREVRLNSKPKRIISLVPSQTEFLYEIGLENEVVGITKFCIYPTSWFKNKMRIGGTKNVNFELVKSLNPDLIIGNKEENTKEDFEKLTQICPVWMSDIYTLEDSFSMMYKLGELTAKVSESELIVRKIENSLKKFTALSEKKTVLYLIWNNPIFAVGENTFIHDLLTRFGLENIVKDARYPEIKPADFQHADYIFLSSEPFHFTAKHKIEIQDKFPKSKIIHVDGELFSWYGSRLLHTIGYFDKLKLKL